MLNPANPGSNRKSYGLKKFTPLTCLIILASGQASAASYCPEGSFPKPGTKAKTLHTMQAAWDGDVLDNCKYENTTTGNMWARKEKRQRMGQPFIWNCPDSNIRFDAQVPPQEAPLIISVFAKSPPDKSFGFYSVDGELFTKEKRWEKEGLHHHQRNVYAPYENKSVSKKLFLIRHITQSSGECEVIRF